VWCCHSSDLRQVGTILISFQYGGPSTCTTANTYLGFTTHFQSLSFQNYAVEVVVTIAIMDAPLSNVMVVVVLLLLKFSQNTRVNFVWSSDSTMLLWCFLGWVSLEGFFPMGWVFSVAFSVESDKITHTMVTHTRFNIVCVTLVNVVCVTLFITISASLCFLKLVYDPVFHNKDLSTVNCLHLDPCWTLVICYVDSFAVASIPIAISCAFANIWS